MKKRIVGRFRRNISRVRRLTALGATTEPDVLRAAVVLLHATVEDLVRGIVDARLPSAAPRALADLPLVGARPNSVKFTLQDLAVHRGSTVAEVIEASVSEYLARSNYNDPSQVLGALERVGIEIDGLRQFQRSLALMMSRRHWIVHQADQALDRVVLAPLRPISAADVDPLVATVESMATIILEQIS